jgi:hypothetical protein
MLIPSIYINLEDDVTKIITRLNREKSGQVILVCPKRCFLFSDSINLRLLKKNTDLIKKEVFILTMDERGQQYAQEAGFKLRFLPKQQPARSISDIQQGRAADSVSEIEPGSGNQTVPEIKESTPVASDAILEVPTVPVVVETKRNPVKSPPVRRPQISMSKDPSSVSVSDTLYPEMESASAVGAKIKSEKRLGRVIVGLVVVSVLLILAVLFVVLPKAEVVVYAKSEPVSRDFKISMSFTASTTDVDHLLIPAQKVVLTLDSQDQFQSQGKKPVGSKAGGNVVLYNFTTLPINLKSSTTSFILGTKTYVLVPELVQVKPTKYKTGTKEIDPASLGAPVEIEATQGGDEYNVPEGTRLEITNKVFGSKPQFLFAKTSEALTGGNSRYVSVVTDQDLNNSQAQLSQSLIAQVRQGLAQDGLILPDGGFAVETIQFSADKPVGTESPVFSATLKGKVTGLAFSESDLKKLVQNRVKQNISTEKPTDIQTKTLQYKLETAPDFNNGIGTLLVHFDGGIVYKLSLDDLPKALAGKNRDQVNDIIKSKPEIDHADITLAPSWQTSFPYFPKKIHVTVGK